MRIKLLDWRDEPISAPKAKGDAREPYLLKVGLVDLSEIALEINSRESKPFGLVPPYDLDNLAYTFRCMATIGDHFPMFPVYAPIPLWCAREAIRATRGAGSQHFILPFYDPWAFVHQTVHDLLEGKMVHVAGGNPAVDGWTWSEEKL